MCKLGPTIAMNKAEYQKKLKEKERLDHIKSLEAEKNRARSINIGSAGAGVTEITMRSANGEYIWYLMQPVEVVELIHQLSANVGCHLHLTPREDFSSWRIWNEQTIEDKLHLNGHPPHPSDLALSHHVGTLSSPQEENLLEPVMAKEKQNVAAKKIVNKRSIKRSRTSSK